MSQYFSYSVQDFIKHNPFHLFIVDNEVAFILIWHIL